MKQRIEHKAKYKPLSFDTTMRNPERIAKFLNCLTEFEGQILTNQVIHNVVKKAIGTKIYATVYEKSIEYYKDIYISEDVQFSDADLEDIIENSPQKHKEAGFDYGWPSRFDTWFSLPKEYGFVWYEMHEPIKISQTGHMLIDALNQVPADNRKIQNIFLNAMCKYQSANPFRKTLINNVPMVLLLKVIKRFKDLDPNVSGIYRQELSFFICWPDDDDEELFEYILDFRNRHYYHQYTDEIIYEECLKLLGYGEADKNYVKMEKVTGETVDEYIRKMKITGIFSLRGNGRFIDFNRLEMDKIDYILKSYSNFYNFPDCESYFAYMESIDPKLFDAQDEAIKIATMADIRKNKLYEIADTWDKEEVLKELKNLCGKKESKHPVLKFIAAPARLEFLVSIAIKQNIPNIEVEANYAVDDEGFPTFTAGGNLPDIICHEKTTDELVEVTLMCSKNDQVNHEMLSITRHQDDAKKKNPDTFSVFIAPRLHPDTKRYVQWIDFRESIKIIPYEIPDFIKNVSKFHTLKNMLS